jgi:hypothetical protein
MKKAKILAVAVIALMVIAPKARALDDLGWYGLGMIIGGGVLFGAGAIASIDSDTWVPGYFMIGGGVSAGIGLIFLLVDVAVSYASVDNHDGIYLVSAEENTGRRNKPVFDILRHLTVVPLREKVFVGTSFSY